MNRCFGFLAFEKLSLLNLLGDIIRLNLLGDIKQVSFKEQSRMLSAHLGRRLPAKVWGILAQHNVHNKRRPQQALSTILYFIVYIRVLCWWCGG